MKSILAGIPDERIRRSLRLSIVDGALWAAMFGLAEYYIVPFALLFGAGPLLVALIQGTGQLMIAAGQLTGVGVARRLKRRRGWVVTSILLHAASWLLIVFGARAVGDPRAILVGFAFGLFVTSMGGPAWISWMNELVPAGIRGRYWGGRNRVVGVVQFFTILAAGGALSLWGEGPGAVGIFTALFVAAAVARGLGAIPVALSVEGITSAASTPTSNPSEHEAPPLPHRGGVLRFMRELVTTPFGRFMLFYGLMLFAAGLMGPTIPLYLLDSLGLGYFDYTIVMMTSMVLSFLAMSYWGPLSDRFGNYRILTVTGIVLPLIGAGWALARTVPALLAVQAIAGFAWAGFNLSATNYIFDTQPPERTGRVMAYFLALTNGFAFLGSLLAGLIAERVRDLRLPLLAPGNYELVFLLSALLRLVVFVAMIRTFAEVRPVEGVPRKRYFYFQQPMAILAARLEFFRTVVLRRRPHGEDGTSG